MPHWSSSSFFFFFFFLFPFNKQTNKHTHKHHNPQNLTPVTWCVLCAFSFHHSSKRHEPTNTASHFVCFRVFARLLGLALSSSSSRRRSSWALEVGAHAAYGAMQLPLRTFQAVYARGRGGRPPGLRGDRTGRDGWERLVHEQKTERSSAFRLRNCKLEVGSRVQGSYSDFTNLLFMF